MYVTRTDEGNTRVLVTLFDLPGYSLCIINCYLPSGQSGDAISKYREDVDVIFEITMKFRGSYEVLIIGDLNEDHFNRDSIKEILMRKLMVEIDARDLGIHFAHVPTYEYSILGHESHLDHAFICTTHDSVWKDVYILNDSEFPNLSKHHPIVVSLQTCSLTSPQVSGKKRKAMVRFKYNWKKVDSFLFVKTLEDSLSDKIIDFDDVEASLEKLHLVLKTATEKSVPKIYLKLSPGHIRWSPELKEAIQNSKDVHKLWKEAGRPKKGQIHDERIKTKKIVRKIKRKLEEHDQFKLLNEISNAAESDPILLHKLIARQRTSVKSGNCLKIDDRLLTNKDEILEAWAVYYENLGCDTDFDKGKENILLELMRDLADKDPANSIYIDAHVVSLAIRDLKNNKAADRHGIVAEQLKLLLESDSALSILTDIIRSIFIQRKVPETLKQSYKISLPKKGKCSLIQDNHRGITITPLVGKVVELILRGPNNEIESKLPKDFLQFGFTKENSPDMASLIISEACAECHINKEDLLAGTLDARKAFDVVKQVLLKAKLYDSSLEKDLWCIVDSLYTGGSEVFRLNGEFSRSYSISLGVKQGGILSPILYKLYLSGLLNSLAQAQLGLMIGIEFLGSPTVADDVLLLSNRTFQMQCMLDICKLYSGDHEYDLHPTKSLLVKMIEMSCGNTVHEDKPTCTLGQEPMKEASSFEHLGLEWSAGKRYPNVDARVSSARRLSYLLFGSGLHGRNGLDPGASFKVITSYVSGSLLHGLNATVLPAKEFAKADSYYKTLLRRIQSLPTSTATSAIYRLLGAIPLEGIYHMRVMSLFGQICRLSSEHPLKRLAVRQLAIRENNSGSWFSQLRTIADRYEIDITSQLLYPWSKASWKSHYKRVIQEAWEARLRKDCHEKSSLAYIIWDNKNWLVHGIWRACRGRPHFVEAAVTRARMLAGRYSCGSAPWRRGAGDICPACSELEDLPHIIYGCPVFRHITSKLRDKLKSLFMRDNLPPPRSAQEWVSVILNGDRYTTDDYQVVALRSHETEAHTMASQICHRIHTQRDLYINDVILNERSSLTEQEDMNETIPYEILS